VISVKILELKFVQYIAEIKDTGNKKDKAIDGSAFNNQIFQ